MTTLIRCAVPAVAALALTAGVFAQGSGDTPCDAAVTTIMGLGAWDYDTSVGTTASGIDTVGNPCNSAAPPAPDSADSLHLDRWFRWSPAMSGNYLLDTCSMTNTGGGGIANYDTKVAIFNDTGNCMDITTGTANFIACGEDGPGATCLNFSTSFLATGLIAGQDYWIQCGGWSSIDVGPAVLTVAFQPPPVNDDCANATNISGLGTFPFDNEFASTDGLPDPLCDFFNQDDIDQDVWYRWTAPMTAMYKIDTCSLTTVDTKIAVYADQACPATAPLNCVDDDCPNATFQTDFVDFSANGGDVFLIRLGTFIAAGGGTGDMQISVSGGPTPIGTPYCTSLPNSSGAGATIAALGDLSVAAQSLILEASNMPNNVNGIFYYGTNQTSVPFGNGFRCVAGVVQRLPFNNSDGMGVMRDPDVYSNAMNNLPISATSLNFQAWFRDQQGGGLGFNLSDGVNITFTP